MYIHVGKGSLSKTESMPALHMNVYTDTWHPTNSATSQETEDHSTRVPLVSHWIYWQCAGLLRKDLKDKHMVFQSGFTSTLREGQVTSLLPRAQNTHQLMTVHESPAQKCDHVPATWQSLFTSRPVWSTLNPTFKNFIKSFQHSGKRLPPSKLWRCQSIFSFLGLN